VVAPSRGTGDSHTLRRLNIPRRVDVRIGGGTPIALRRNGGWLKVVELLDRYRIDDRWWTERRVARTYYALLLEDGRTVTIFHDEMENSWYEQRYG